MTGRRAGTAALVAIAVAASFQSAGAYPRPGNTTRVSVSSTGAQADYTAAPTSRCALVHTNTPCSATLSATGRYVVFSTPATNLVPRDTNAVPDVFLRDRATSTTEIESVSSNGQLALALPSPPGVTGISSGSFEPDVTPNGRWVVFTSNALNLVPGDHNLAFDVFLRDRQTGQTQRISVTSSGAEANGDSTDPVISADGRYIAFASDATNLVSGDTNGAGDIFVRDRVTGKTTRVSTSSQGVQGDGESKTPAISANGRDVAFTTQATTFGGQNPNQSVYVHDVKSGQTEIVSVASGAAAVQADYVNGNGAFTGPHSLSADGRYVTFRATQSTLVPNDTGFRGSSWDVFVHDRRTGHTERVSVTSSGAELDDGGVPNSQAESNYPAISPDGRFVAFYTNINGPVPGYTSAYVDIHDMVSRVTETVSLRDVQAKDLTCDAHAQGLLNADPTLSVSTGGRFVAFISCDGTLVKGDTNNGWDTFVRERGIAQGVDAIAVGHMAVAGERPVQASAVYRPASRDLLFRIDDLQLANTSTSTAAVVYGIQLSVGGRSYQARAAYAGAAATFALFRAEASGGWTQIASLDGGFGTVGSAVEFAVPLAALGATGPGQVRHAAAFAGLGSVAAGPVPAPGVLDAVTS